MENWYFEKIIPVLTVPLIYLDGLLLCVCVFVSFRFARNIVQLILLSILLGFDVIIPYLCFFFINNFNILVQLAQMLLIPYLLDILASLRGLSLIHHTECPLDIRLDCLEYLKMLIALLNFLQEVL